MKKIIRISLLIFICCISCTLHAQQVTISTHYYDSLRNVIQDLDSQTLHLKDSCTKQNSIITELEMECTKISKLESDMSKLRSKVSRDSIELVNKDKQLKSLQYNSDRNIARLANGRLYFKYDEKLINESIDSIRTLRTPSVKQKFSQVLGLLQRYKSYSEDLKNILVSAQNDQDRKARNKGDEFKAKYRRLISQDEYYRNVYLKKASGNWSIPYLDNIIDVALRALSHHNPGHGDYVDFTVLIEML